MSAERVDNSKAMICVGRLFLSAIVICAWGILVGLVAALSILKPTGWPAVGWALALAFNAVMSGMAFEQLRDIWCGPRKRETP